jgi:hypothetical protein
MGWACRMQTKNAYRQWIGKYQVKKILWRHRCTWQENIRMDISEIRCENVNWNVSGQGLMVGFHKHGYEPSGSVKSGNFLTGWATTTDSRKILAHGFCYSAVAVSQSEARFESSWQWRFKAFCVVVVWRWRQGLPKH